MSIPGIVLSDNGRNNHHCVDRLLPPHVTFEWHGNLIRGSGEQMLRVNTQNICDPYGSGKVATPPVRQVEAALDMLRGVIVSSQCVRGLSYTYSWCMHIRGDMGGGGGQNKILHKKSLVWS